MKIVRLIFCITAAFVGAGFASGREIMQFFSRYGAFSYPLIGAASAALGLMTGKMTECALFPAHQEKSAAAGLKKALLFALYTGTAGAMTAAAGELAALTAPLAHARTLGMVLTLAACYSFSARSLTALRYMGYVLLPLTAAAFLLCARVPPDAMREQVTEHTGAALPALLSAVCYSAMNAVLSAGVLQEAGAQCTQKEKRRLALGAGCVTALLLLLGNGALLPHRGSLAHAALPTVLLLCGYGKAGYWLAAAFFYLAVSSTLTAVLQSLRETIRIKEKRHGFALTLLPVMTVAACGFETIVETAYPLCGFLCLILILCTKKRGPGAPAEKQV